MHAKFKLIFTGEFIQKMMGRNALAFATKVGSAGMSFAMFVALDGQRNLVLCFARIYRAAAQSGHLKGLVQFSYGPRIDRSDYDHNRERTVLNALFARRKSCVSRAALYWCADLWCGIQSGGARGRDDRVEYRSGSLDDSKPRHQLNDIDHFQQNSCNLLSA